MQQQSIHYKWRRLEGYQAPIMLVIGPRGIGKTFQPVLGGVNDFSLHKKRFIYVCESDEMVQELTQNSGEKFFSKIIEFLEKNPSRSHKRLLALLTGRDRVSAEITQDDPIAHIKGGTIRINNETAGYMVSLNGFAKVKRNNFVKVGRIIIDEFIPETVNITSLKNAYKMVSIVQSIARTQKDIRIYMLGNSLRTNDMVLARLGLDNMKPGELRGIADKYGRLIIADFVDPAEYPEFMKESDASIAGRLAAILKENKLEQNEFANALTDEERIPDKPKSVGFLHCLHGANGVSIRISRTKDNSEIYITRDYGSNVSGRCCLDAQYQTETIRYAPQLRNALLMRYVRGDVRFETATCKTIFKSILKLKE